MTLLSPALLAGLLALAIPVIVHLVQRERRRVVEFPSLMFLRKIPRQAVKRRALRHWPLLALRLAALALLALAFARPFIPRADMLSVAGGRDVIVLLDRSMSMGYGDHWDRARAEARRAFGELGAGDVGTLMLFDTNVEVGPRSTSDRTSLAAAVNTAALTARGTRIGPALRAAAAQLDRSRLTRREIVLISDFQRTAWDRATDARLPPGVVLHTREVGSPSTSNVAVAGLSFERMPQGPGERVTATARFANRSAAPLAGRGVVLEVDGREIDRGRVSAGAGAVVSHAFASFTAGADAARVTVRVEADGLPGDDRFHAVITPARRVKALVLQSATPHQDASLYLSRALGVAADPGFDVTITAAARATPADIDAADIVILNDSPPPPGAAGAALDARVRAGAGLFVALGERSSWPAGAPDLLPGTPGNVMDRSGTRGLALGFVDYSHPIFEVFKAPRSGDLSAARVYRYRALTPGPAVLARFDNDAVALAERRVGAGTVLVWATTFDSYWNDLALKPVFVPFVLQAMRHLGRFGASAAWHTVGDTIDAAPAAAKNPGGGGARVVLDEPGFVEVTPRDPALGSVVAVNVPTDESELARVPPEDLAAAVVVPGGSRAAGGTQSLTIEEQEQRQALWWYLAAAGVVLLVIESVVAGRLPRLA